MGVTYRDAGLNLDLYEQTIAGIGQLAARTHDRTRVLGGFGGFASLFDLEPNRWLFSRKYRHPVLVTCTDGVGTKLKVAVQAHKHDTVGIDLVAMSVNDALCCGGEPLVFLDYVAMSQDDPELTKQIVQGISDGCVEAECSLTGGETAILPGMYQPGEYDLAGFCVGIVERDKIIDGKAIQVGDAVVGMASSGLHSNGFSLARKIAFEVANRTIGDHVPELGKTVGEELLTPTKIYVKPVKQILHHYPIKRRVVRGLAHITGGGLVDNIPRILPPGRRVKIRRGSWPEPAVFTWLRKLGEVAEDEMDRVFNCGIGFVMIVSQYFAESIVRRLRELQFESYLIGEVVAGDPGVDLVK